MKATSYSTAKFYSMKETMARYSICRNTLRGLVESGSLQAYRTEGGHRKVSVASCLQYFEGIEPDDHQQSGSVILYARVSGRKQGQGFSTEDNSSTQDSDLSRQVSRLRQAATERGYSEDETTVLADVGSGLSYTRKGFAKFVDEVLAGKHDGLTVLATFKDRIVRFGLELVLQIFAAHSITLEFVEAEPDKSEEVELTEDLLNILHIFSCKSYSKRGIETLSKSIPQETIQRAYELRHKQGLPITSVVKILNSEGHTSESKHEGATPITRNVITKYLRDDALLKQAGIVKGVLDRKSDGRTSFEIFLAEKTVRASSTDKVLSKTINEEYRAWYAGQNGSMTGRCLLSTLATGKIMRAEGYEKYKTNGEFAYKGITLR